MSEDPKYEAPHGDMLKEMVAAFREMQRAQREESIFAFLDRTVEIYTDELTTTPVPVFDKDVDPDKLKCKYPGREKDMSEANIKPGDKVIYKTIIHEVADVQMQCCPCIIGQKCSDAHRVDVVYMPRIETWAEIDEVIKVPPQPKKKR